MMQSKITKLATTLTKTKEVEFVHNEFFYTIFESSDSGYSINLYSCNYKDEYGGYLDEYLIDGGLCTGSAENAIEFML